MFFSDLPVLDVQHPQIRGEAGVGVWDRDGVPTIPLVSSVCARVIGSRLPAFCPKWSSKKCNIKSCSQMFEKISQTFAV